ncbi:hypothetical protein RND81_12G110300 [Saponaria officinalis]|uniref:Uncharacterized protein n=1 Tax=Saponaria officinalis TaxID=3572 RepID=A0AAW1H951_SAPOF
MKTLLALNQQPKFYITTNQTKCDQTTQLLHSTKLHTFSHSKTSWKLHAQAKGFGNTSKNSTSIQKKENASKTSSNKQEEGEEDDDDTIPQVVFDRMLKRILASVGLPMGIGLLILKVIDYLKEEQIWDVPLWVAFMTTFVFLGSSVLGVAYGSLSTSWNADKTGSLLGFNEAKENWTQMWKEDEEEDSKN